MRGLRLLAALLVLAISACGVLEKPLTVTPWVVTATDAPLATNTPLFTPTREVLATAMPFQVVNVNAFLQGQPQIVQVNGRTLEIPPQWSYAGDANPAPFFYRRDDGYLIQPEWLAGKFGLASDFQAVSEQAYILKITAIAGLQGSGDVSLGCVLYNSDGGGITELIRQNVRLLGYQEFVWVLISRRDNPTVHYECTFGIVWPSLQGTIVLRSIEWQTAPADYGLDARVEF